MTEILNQLLQNPLAISVIGFGLLMALFAFLVWVYPILKWKKQGYPGEDKLEEALLPFMLDAIVFIFKMSDRMIDEGSDRLHRGDKELLARRLWGLLPDEVNISLGPFHYVFEPKEILDQESWALLVKKAYDDILTRYDEFAQRYEAEFLEWLIRNDDGPVEIQ